MKTGRSLSALANELERQMETKRDYIADTSALTMLPNTKLEMRNGDMGQDLGLTDYAHGQVASRVKIPKVYYDRMRENAPALLADNVNHWFHKNPEKRMVRTLDDTARAFLSDRYRPIDNYDLLDAVLPRILELGCDVQSCELTQTRMYLKVTTPRLTADVKKGDVVQAGLVLSNSEIGAGSVRVEPLMFRLVCLNGMIINDASLKKYHVGKLAEQMEGQVQFYRHETMAADNKAFFMKVTDTVNGVLQQDVFDGFVRRLRETAAEVVEADPVTLVDNVTDRFLLKDDERSGILKHLTTGGDLTRYGLIQAVTRTSQDVDDYQRATDLETLGGSIMELPRRDWAALAAA